MMSSATKCYNWGLINDKLWYFCCLGDDCEPMDTEVAIVGHVWRKHMRPQTPHQSVADTQPPTPVMSVHSTDDVLDVKIVSNGVPIEVLPDDEEEEDRDQSADLESVTEWSPIDEMAIGESVVADTDVSDESSTGGSFDTMTDEEEDEDSDRNVYYEWDCERQVNDGSAVASGQSDAPSHHVLDETFVTTDGSIDVVPEEDSGHQSVDNESVARSLEIDDQSSGQSVPAATVAPTDTLDDQWIDDKVCHKCPHNGCDYQTLNRIGFSNHIRCDHPIGRLYRCDRPDCDAVYTTRGQLRKHVMKHRCGYGFDHMPGAHPVTGVCNETNIKRFRQMIVTAGQKAVYNCRFTGCGFTTQYATSIRDHIHGQHVCPNRANLQSKGMARVSTVGTIDDKNGDIEEEVELGQSAASGGQSDTPSVAGVVDNEEVVLEFEPYSANIVHNKRRVCQSSGSTKKRSMNWHQNNPQVTDQSAIDTQPSARSLSLSVHSNDNLSDETFVLTDGPMDVTLDEESVDHDWGQSMDYSLGGDGSSESTLSANSPSNVLDYHTANNRRVSPKKSRSKRVRRPYRCQRDGCDAAYATLSRYYKHVSYHRCGYRMDDIGGADDPMVNAAGVCGLPNIDRYLETKVAADGYKWSYCLFNGCAYKTKNSSNLRDHIHAKHICPNRSAVLPVRPISTSITRILAEEPIGGQNDANRALNCAANAVLKNGIYSDRKISQKSAMRNVGQTSGSVVKSVAVDEFKVKIRPFKLRGNGVHRFNQSMD